MSDFNFAIPGLMGIQSPASDDLPPIIVLSPHNLVGSPWVGVETIGPVEVNGETPASPASLLFMEFSRTSDFCKICRTLASDGSGDGLTSIVEPGAWLFSVPEQDLPLERGMWYWRLRVVAEDESVMKLYGGTIIVRP